MSDLVGNPEDRFSHNEAHFFQSCTNYTEKEVKTSLQVINSLHDQLAALKGMYDTMYYDQFFIHLSRVMRKPALCICENSRISVAR